MGKRATIKDVAREANVSAATISYVLNNKESISEETKQKVYDAIAKLKYVPNLSAQGLSSNSSKLIGIVVPQTEPGSKLMFENPFYSEILSSIEYTARNFGYHVIISGTDADASYLKLAQQRNLDGIILIGFYPDEFYSELKKAEIPVVLIDSYCMDYYYHSIRINDRYGAYIATKYLLEKGHRDIAFVSGVIKNGGVVEARYLGYGDALKEFKVPVRDKYVFEGLVDFDSGMEQAENIIKSKLKVTAIFASADIIAVGVIKRLNQLGKIVPDDFSVIGFDDLSISKFINPGLTTVHQDIYKKGEAAVQLLMNALDNPETGKQEIIIPVSIVERESVKGLESAERP